jgi:hypothetical protein
MTDPKPRFMKGQKVRATEYAYEAGLFPRKSAPVTGTVRGFGRLPNTVRVQRDNQASTERYAEVFWEPTDV